MGLSLQDLEKVADPLSPPNMIWQLMPKAECDIKVFLSMSIWISELRFKSGSQKKSNDSNMIWIDKSWLLNKNHDLFCDLNCLDWNHQLCEIWWILRDFPLQPISGIFKSSVSMWLFKYFLLFIFKWRQLGNWKTWICLRLTEMWRMCIIYL